MKKNATIRDVAKLAGVSITTVSFVLKGIGRFSDETIKRVWEAVNSLGYTPNPYVKKLLNRERSPHKKTDLLMRIFYQPSDVTFSDIILNYLSGCFESACQKNDYFGTSYAYRDILGFRNKLLVNDLVDGVVLGLPHKDIIQLVRSRVPCVLTGIDADPMEVAMPVIHFDHAKAFSRAFAEVRQRGWKGNLAVFRGYGPQRFDDSLYHDYSIGYLEKAALENHIPLLKKHCFDVDVTVRNNPEKMEEIADKAFHLIREENVRFIALHLITPLTLLKSLLEKRGIRFPEEALLFGVTDHPGKEPGIVEITRSWHALMDTAVAVLLRHLEGKETENRKYLVECCELEKNIFK